MQKELSFTQRDAKNKTESKQLRRQGQIPAILYSHGKEGKKIAIANADLQKILSQSKVSGLLSTTQFQLKGEGKTFHAILKEIQYHVTTYDPLHVDFEELHADTAVTLHIPIQLTGVVDCIGVKLGGSIQQLMRYVKVKCLPKHIPSHFEIDVRELNVGQEIRLNQLSISKDVQSLENAKSIVVSITTK